MFGLYALQHFKLYVQQFSIPPYNTKSMHLQNQDRAILIRFDCSIIKFLTKKQLIDTLHGTTPLTEQVCCSNRTFRTTFDSEPTQNLIIIAFMLQTFANVVLVICIYISHRQSCSGSKRNLIG